MAYRKLSKMWFMCDIIAGELSLTVEILAHIVGWAAQATDILPRIITGLPPQTYTSEFQHNAIDEAFNADFIILLGEQSFEQVLTLPHQSHQQFVQMLKAQDENIFVSGNYVYERMKRVSDHHLQHAQELENTNTV
jgi:hypothetical protein